MADSTIPLKRCSRGDACLHPEGPSLPATLEYFSKHGPRLRSRCKYCHRRDALDWAKQNPKKANAGSYRWTRNNQERRKEIRRRSYRNSERQRQTSRERNQRLWKAGGRERLREKRAQKPWIYKLSWHLRITRKRRLPDTLTEQEWQETLVAWRHRCAICGAEGDITADHWIPLSSPNCPGTTKNNMIPLCGSCNYSKQRHNALEWMTWRFGREYALERYAVITAYLAQF
jgi:hypothetical protein